MVCNKSHIVTFDDDVNSIYMVCSIMHANSIDDFRLQDLPEMEDDDYDNDDPVYIPETLSVLNG